MQPWFPNAKLGIFLHWGLYSVKGVAESWSFFNGDISHEDYFAQKQCFGADRYDPQAWAELFARVGARYAVLTTKHHDGFALWPTAHQPENSILHAPAAQHHEDLVGPYCQALRDHGIKVGLYFSHLDWSHPDFASMMHGDEDREEAMQRAYTGKQYEHPMDGIDQPERWEKFIAFHRAQLKELSDRYHPDLFWFDGSWTHNNAQWDFKGLRDQLHHWNPQGVILNSRMGKNPCYGDYETPEQAIPIKQPKPPWEFCWTLNDHWGYFTGDDNHKSTRLLVRTFCDVIGMGGNLLLGIGPHADGSLQPAQVQRLLELGDWVRPRAEAIYETTAGVTHDHFLGASTLSQDRQSLYLFQYDLPQEGIYVKGIFNKVKRVSVLGGEAHGQELKHAFDREFKVWKLPGVLHIDLPQQACDPLTTCIKIELEGELDLYSGAGHMIEAN